MAWVGTGPQPIPKTIQFATIMVLFNSDKK